LAYQQNIFIETQPEPGNESFGTVEEGFWFHGCSPEFKESHARYWIAAGKIVRVSHFNPIWLKKDENPYHKESEELAPHFPATDTPFHPDYTYNCECLPTFDDGQGDSSSIIPDFS